MNDDNVKIQDPLKQALLQDEIADSIFEKIIVDPEYIEAFSRYDKGEMDDQEFNSIIVKLSEKYI